MAQSPRKGMLRPVWGVILTIGFLSIPLPWATYQSSSAVFDILVFIPGVTILNMEVDHG